MTLILLSNLQEMWVDIMVALIHTFPFFFGAWFIFWIFRGLLFGKD